MESSIELFSIEVSVHESPDPRAAAKNEPPIKHRALMKPSSFFHSLSRYHKTHPRTNLLVAGAYEVGVLNAGIEKILPVVYA
jgi:hypothetical protein